MPSQQELMAAYAATRFEADTPDGLIVLRIGQRTEARERRARLTSPRVTRRAFPRRRTEIGRRTRYCYDL
jgi:hypothetical protein